MIEFDHVSMAYQLSEELALKNVSFKVERGEFVFIIGSSGSGKSTIIKLLTCEERPLKGEIIVNGFSLNTIKKKQIPYLRRNIGMVFQDFRLIPSKTVFENVSYAMEIVGASRKAILHQVPMVLSIVGLRNRQSAYPYELSGGEQQRVAIARAMVNRPMMILADEPTGNLDPVNSESIMALLAEINKSGTTVLVCSHDKDLVNRMKRRVILIDDGMKIRDDSEGGFYADDSYLPGQSIMDASVSQVTQTEVNRLSSAQNENTAVSVAQQVAEQANQVDSRAEVQTLAQDAEETVEVSMQTQEQKLKNETGSNQLTAMQKITTGGMAKLANDSVTYQAPKLAGINVSRVNTETIDQQARLATNRARTGQQMTMSNKANDTQLFGGLTAEKMPCRNCETTNNSNISTPTKPLSWASSMRDSLYHEETDDKLFDTMDDDDLATIEGTELNSKRSNLSSERIERWGKRRF